ncbi:MAG: histidine phosphatase family protein [Candidatus Micrarchaeia archaeon]|jgi:broad specificity phosphatase PhoE
MANTVFIVRHGEAESNVKKYFSGWGEAPLTGLGMEQARLLHKRLEKEGIGRAFCSDTLRTKQTLDLLSIKCPVVYSPSLREQNYGKLEGVVWGEDEVKYTGFHFDPYRRAPGGESPSDVQKRVWSYFNAAIFSAKEEKVLVVSHHGAIVTFACKFLGMPLSNWRALRLGNCGLCILTKDDGMWRLKLWNSLSHYGLLNFKPLLTREARVPPKPVSMRARPK